MKAAGNSRGFCCFGVSLFVRVADIHDRVVELTGYKI